MPSVRRLALLLSLAVVLGFGLRALVRALASDETRIRWRVEEMAEGFDATRMNPILAGLAHDFVDDGSGATKEELRAALAQAFLQRKDPVTKAFPWRVKLREGEPRARVAGGEPRTAEFDTELAFEESHGAEWTPCWRVRVHAELIDTDDGWKIRRTRVDTLDGRRMR